MPSKEISSFILSLGVFFVAMALLVWQRMDRLHRDLSPSVEDDTYFRRQDRRRGCVVGVMILLAAGIYSGSRMDHLVNDRPNVWFLGLWMGVFWLVIILSFTALIDWIATRQFAHRHRRKIIREGLSILREDIKTRVLKVTHSQELDEGNDLQSSS